MTIKDLNPQSVWKNFYSLTQIPRPSKKEGKAVEFMYNFGKGLGLETYKDETGNVIIRKPATPGMENRKGVILQAHLDMVPQKNADKVHDFEKDPIETYVDGDWVRANGTTLGADNGLGVAVAMSVLESKELKHGPVEALFTVDEETGMTGARALKPGLLNGEILINLDSETEGELYVGCAGGLDVEAVFDYKECPAPASGYVPFRLNVKGFKGGHSGMDIILGRANANKLMARVLLPLMRDCGALLCDVEGGTLRNAIPREAFAVILVPSAKTDDIKASVRKAADEIKAEYALVDPDGEIFLEEVPAPAAYIEEDAALRFIKAVHCCPNGVERMSDAVPGLVETSNNMAVIRTAGGKASVLTLMRSSVDTAKDAFAEDMRCLFELAGARISFSGGYSGWAPKMDSPILSTMKHIYKSLYGNEPAVMAIHAGLECGILGGTYPSWDMISCGPTIKSPHSPDERADWHSVGKWWDFIVKVLEEIPAK